MFGQENTPIYFYALVTAEKKLLLVDSDKGWTLPGRTGYDYHPVSGFLRERLTGVVENLAVDKGECIFSEPHFHALDHEYFCHVYVFNASFEIKEGAQKKILLANDAGLVEYILHEHIRGIVKIPALQNRLR